MMKQPFFILGTHRSGTTLLTRMLSSHPRVFVQNEISVEKVFTGSPDRTRIIQAISREIERRHNQPIQRLLDKLNKSTWGVKDPQLTEYLELLEQFTEDCKFILIIRDPRAVVSSYIENRWGLGTNAYSGALRWKREVNAQLDFARRHSSLTLTVYFESLLNDPRTELEKVCAHVGEDFDEAVLAHHKSKAMYKSNQSNINTQKPIDRDKSISWSRKLTAHQIGIIETICDKEMTALGYTPSTPPVVLTGLEKSYYGWHQKILGEIQLQYQLKKSRVRSLLARAGN